MSSVMAIIISLSLVCVPSLLSDFLYRNKNLAKKDKSFQNDHACFIKGFKVNGNLLNIMYYPLYIFRRLVFAAIIVLIPSFPELQLAFIAVSTLCVFFWIYSSLLDI